MDIKPWKIGQNDSIESILVNEMLKKIAKKKNMFIINLEFAATVNEKKKDDKPVINQCRKPRMGRTSWITVTKI